MKTQVTAATLARKTIDSGFELSSDRVLPTTNVFDAYWHFAYERQEVFFKRLEGIRPPWTRDPVLQTYRFTNVYRASDRVSQFLIRHVIYEGKQTADEVFFRVLLFKLFNRIETWNLLIEQLGELTWRNFRIGQYEKVLDNAMASGGAIYSPAYIMPCPGFGSRRKHANHLRLLEWMMREGFPRKIEDSRSLEQVFRTLRSLPSVGDFLAYQFSIDLNYSEIINYSEMDFVVAGPGARSGIKKAFHDLNGLTHEQIIREVATAAPREFGQRGLRFRSLWGRPLQLIDCQNLFCEVDKYARVAFPSTEGDGRIRIKRKFHPSQGLELQWYPPKWKLLVQ